MKEIRTSGPLMFSDPNCPTRVGEIINTISEISDIPNPCEGMQVYVRDEKKTYTITGLKEAIIGGERVPNAKVDTFEAVKSKVEEIDNNFAKMREALNDGSFVVGIANLANEVKAGAVTFEMLDGKLQLSASVVDNLETANTLKPLSANQGKVLKELIDVINGTGEGSTDKKIADAIALLVDSAPENLDTLRELSEWIESHGTEFAAVVDDINKIKKDALLADSVHVSQYAEKINIGGRSLDEANTISVDILAATSENAGVMSAEDKERVDGNINSASYAIADAAGNIIFKVDKEGLKTSEVTTLRGKLSELLDALSAAVEVSKRELGALKETTAQTSRDVASKMNREADNDFFAITDAAGNIIFKVDAGGVHSINVGNPTPTWVIIQVLSEAYIPSNIERDSEGDVISCNALFSDGIAGTIVLARKNGDVSHIVATHGGVNAEAEIIREDGNVKQINIL